MNAVGTILKTGMAYQWKGMNELVQYLRHLESIGKVGNLRSIETDVILMHLRKTQKAEGD